MSKQIVYFFVLLSRYWLFIRVIHHSSVYFLFFFFDNPKWSVTITFVFIYYVRQCKLCMDVIWCYMHKNCIHDKLKPHSKLTSQDILKIVRSWNVDEKIFDSLPNCSWRKNSIKFGFPPAFCGWSQFVLNTRPYWYKFWTFTSIPSKNYSSFPRTYTKLCSV